MTIYDHVCTILYECDAVHINLEALVHLDSEEPQVHTFVPEV